MRSCPTAIVDPQYGASVDPLTEPPESIDETPDPIDSGEETESEPPGSEETFYGNDFSFVESKTLSGGGIAGLIIMVLVLHAALFSGYLLYKKKTGREGVLGNSAMDNKWLRYVAVLLRCVNFHPLLLTPERNELYRFPGCFSLPS